MKRICISILCAAILLAGCVPPATLTPALPTEKTAPTAAATTVPAATLAPSPTVPPAPRRLVAYIGLDRNLWLVNVETSQTEPITEDAASYSSDNSTTVISYDNPVWSSDGKYLAFTRETGIPDAEGYIFSFDLMVYDYERSSTRVVLQGQQTAGMDWKPGSHILAYGKPVLNGYFLETGDVDSSLAAGIWTVDVDTGDTKELVKPLMGLHLARPQWSPNGEVIGFQEIRYMEGLGTFAFHELSGEEYVFWEKIIGNMDWSPDGSQLVYDKMIYMPNYMERIFMINRDRTNEHQISPDTENSYAMQPGFSPDGSQVVYLSVEGYDLDTRYRVMLLDLQSGEPRELAVFSQVEDVQWTPDGTALLLSAGNFPEMQVLLLTPQDGSQQNLAYGRLAAMQP